MIEENGVVVAVNSAGILVETRRRRSCDACHGASACGSAVLQRVLGVRRNRINALCDFPVAAGDQVVLGLDDSALIRGSLSLYGMPLAGLFAGAFTAAWIQGLLGFPALEWPVVTGAGLGLVSGFMALRRFSLQAANDSRYQAVIVRHLRNTDPIPVVIRKDY